MSRWGVSHDVTVACHGHKSRWGVTVTVGCHGHGGVTVMCHGEFTHFYVDGAQTRGLNVM
eukprot:425795-Amorphochlora_amoeboformis.AAC.1